MPKTCLLAVCLLTGCAFTGSLSAQTPATQMADDEAWAKVQKLLSGVELRVLETGKKKPQTVILDEVRPQALIVVVGKEQRAIAREHIDKIELRLPGGPKRALATATTETTKNARQPAESEHQRRGDAELSGRQLSGGLSPGGTVS